MKLGIIGSGVIVLEALKSIAQTKENKCVALWHRDLDAEGALKLKEEFNIPKLFTDLDEFLKDESIDTVYVGVINSFHYINTKKALEAGKNVICEKPFMPTGAEARELIDLAKSKKLFLFEAIMLRYVDNYDLIRETLPQLGDIKLVQCNYSQYSRRYDKYLEGVVLPAFDPKLAGGCIYDINIYNIHFTMGLFGRPKKYEYFANIGYNGIDVSGMLVLDYGDFKAVCTGAKDSNSKPFCVIQGNKGFIDVASMAGQVQNVSLNLNHEEPRKLGTDTANMMVNEFQKIHQIIASNNYELCYNYMEQSYVVMDVVEKARIAAGVKFD